jgi:hypothetical protein
MNATGNETVPATWDEERDTAFFRITRCLFSADFTFGAGVLLGSYDDEQAATTSVPALPAAATTTDAATPSVVTR